MDAIGGWVNGDKTDRISLRDRGLQFGDGLFETIAVRAGRPLLLERHLSRLRWGGEILGLAIDEPSLRAGIETACQGLDKAVLKVIVTRGVGGRGYAPLVDAAPTQVLTSHPWPDHPPSHQRQGVRVGVCHTRLASQPALAGIKHLNRLEQVLARREWQPTWQEGLVLDHDDRLIEGTMSNLFIVDRQGVARTPALTQCGIAGVVREEILENQNRHAVECRVADLGLEHIADATEMFLTNSLIGLWPVIRCGDRCLEVGPCTRSLQDYLREQDVAVFD